MTLAVGRRAPLPAPVASAPAKALRAWRGDAATWWGQGDAALGAVAYGAGHGALIGAGLPVLEGPAAPCDGWLAAPVRRAGECGPVRWRDDGARLFGQLELPDEPDARRLAHQAYRAVFDTLRQTGRPHLVRLWNYLPRINDEADGLERYRRFNIGRQEAFLEAGADVGEGAPAACALGKAGGTLSVRFLACSRPALPLENPRQTPAYRYSAAWGPRSPTFSRAVLADAGAGMTALLVSGTASIVGEASLHAGDVGAQVHETCTNLRALLDAAHARGTARFDLARLCVVGYVRHAADLATARAALAVALGAASPAVRDAVWLQADVCRRELLVEIEAHAVAPGRLHR